MEKYVCIHGHFYQPPRENPWLEAIEVQDSAHPFHDWNARITAECYAANARSRVLDEKGRIKEIVNNYSRMSFNFGPTLLSWMKDKSPETYQAVLQADRESAGRFGGHGSALAQTYNHMIMPLANQRDKITQVKWGIADFESRFQRKPEGMWLAEAAVDTETLEVLADCGIKFTVLAPNQAARERAIGDRDWRDVTGARIDPSTAYLMNLPSGKFITLFFYDGPASRAVAFEGLLSQGERLARRLLGLLSGERAWPQLAHIATDGETYGHHHRFGDMALAYALDFIENQPGIKLTNYGQYLEKHPPVREVQIVENSSWSCAHGVERWRSDCGCHTGGEAGWNQKWRAPLREALDLLRERVAAMFEEQGKEILDDPWAARDDYIRVILDRSDASLAAFLMCHGDAEAGETKKARALNLMELQRHAQLMYTSCGWFFNDLSGIETVQVLCYAGRVIQLARDLFETDLETDFLALLEKAKSNDPKYQDGRYIYDEFVRPSMLSLADVAAHFAISSVFEDYQAENRIYCYEIGLGDHRRDDAGKAHLSAGRARVTSLISGESQRFIFGVIHFGDHNFSAGVKEFKSQESYQTMAGALSDSFSRADFPEVLRTLDEHFGDATYSIKSLFRDQQRKVLRDIMDNVMAEGEAYARRFYEANAPIMRFLLNLRAPLPKAFRATAELIVNLDLDRAFEEDPVDLDSARQLLKEAETFNLELNRGHMGFQLGLSIERATETFAAQPASRDRLKQLLALVEFAEKSKFPVNYWRVQNLFWDLARGHIPGVLQKAENNDASAHAYLADFRALADLLKVAVNGT